MAMMKLGFILTVAAYVRAYPNNPKHTVMIAKGVTTQSAQSGTCDAIPNTDSITLIGKSVLTRNFGGYGPNNAADEGVVIENVGTNSATSNPIKMVITTTGYADVTSEFAEKTKIKNGFLQIPVKCDSEATFTVSLKDQTTGAAVVVPGFGFTFYDLDQMNDAGGGQECVTVMDYDTVSLAQGTELSDTPVAENGSVGNKYCSSVQGVFSDNPTDPATLSDSHRYRSVSATYTSTASVTFKASVGSCPKSRLIVLSAPPMGLTDSCPVPTVDYLNTTSPAGTYRMAHDYILSQNGKYQAKFQNDGNFVVYQFENEVRSVKWNAKMSKKGGVKVTIENNQLQILASNGTAIWSAATDFSQGVIRNNGVGSFLKMQNDGNLVLYTNATAQRQPVWRCCWFN